MSKAFQGPGSVLGPPMGIEGSEEKLAQPVTESGSFLVPPITVVRRSPDRGGTFHKGSRETHGRQVCDRSFSWRCLQMSWFQEWSQRGDNGYINHRGPNTGHMEGPCSVYGSGTHEVSKRSVHSAPFPYQDLSMKPGPPQNGRDALLYDS